MKVVRPALLVSALVLAGEEEPELAQPASTRALTSRAGRTTFMQTPFFCADWRACWSRKPAKSLFAVLHGGQKPGRATRGINIHGLQSG
ncbi:hypothetical protein SA4R_19495, partial [Pantoea dispersa]